MQIKGILPIAPAVFDENGECDYAGYVSCCKAMLRGGAHGLALFGIAGEYYKMDRDEEEKLIDLTVEVCHRNNAPVIISNTRHATEVAVKWAKRIEAAGADCMMVLPPFFLKPGAAELTRHIEALCDAVSIPIMLQYAPEQTGVAITPEVLAGIGRRHPNLRFYKIECKPPGAYISRLLELLEGTDGEVFIGNAGFQMIEGFRRGAVGVMPGPSMFDVYRKIYDHIQAGETDAAFAIHEKLNAMLNHIRQNVDMIIHFEKKILKRRGLIASDRCRSPQYRCDALNEELFDHHYRELETLFGGGRHD
jgi:4-hydroxy-tetrahydrodipicolinate synthase